MKCPKCSYTSFDYLDECKKCGEILDESRKLLNLKMGKPTLFETINGQNPETTSPSQAAGATVAVAAVASIAATATSTGAANNNNLTETPISQDENYDNLLIGEEFSASETQDELKPEIGLELGESLDLSGLGNLNEINSAPNQEIDDLTLSQGFEHGPPQAHTDFDDFESSTSKNTQNFPDKTEENEKLEELDLDQLNIFQETDSELEKASHSKNPTPSNSEISPLLENDIDFELTLDDLDLDIDTSTETELSSSTQDDTQDSEKTIELELDMDDDESLDDLLADLEK